MDRRWLVRHIKRNGAHLVAMPLDQIGELLRITRRRNELVSRSEYCFGKRASKSTRTARDQPYLWHRNFPSLFLNIRRTCYASPCFASKVPAVLPPGPPPTITMSKNSAIVYAQQFSL